MKDGNPPNPTISARAFWSNGDGTGQISPTAVLSDTEKVVVKSHWSALSKGTETLVYTGRVPASEYQRMRCPFQEGAFPGPVKYGYMAVGEVLSGPLPVGTMVFALHPHQDVFSLPGEAVLEIPSDISPRRAVLAANMETALNGLWDSGIGPGDRVAIVGAGVVGLMVARLASLIPGCDVTLFDIDRDKAEIATTLGTNFTSSASDLGEADLVFHCSGAPSGLETALGACGFEAKLVEMSWYGSQPVTAPLGADFHAKRLTLTSSQVGAVSPGHRPRWTHRRRLEKAINLLADSAWDALISDEIPFDSLPDAMHAIAKREKNPVAMIIRYA